MGDQQAETAVQPETGDQQAATTETDTATAPDPVAELAKWKALAKQNEARAKSNADAARRLAEIEESQKSEQQKLADRAEQAERRAADAEARVLRAEVAVAKGLPAELVGRLAGSTREELEADADTLLTLIRHNGRPQVPPAEVVAGANKGTGSGRDPADIFASLLKGG
jgi:hypothetical protein